MYTERRRKNCLYQLYANLVNKNVEKNVLICISNESYEIYRRDIKPINVKILFNRKYERKPGG